MKISHLNLWVAGLMMLVTNAWAQEGTIPVVLEAKTPQAQEASLYREVSDYLNVYRQAKLGSVSEKQKLIDLTQQKVTLQNQIDSMKDNMKGTRKAKRALYRADRKQDGFSDDYDSVTKEASDRLKAKEDELAQVEKALSEQKSVVLKLQRDEVSDKQFEKKMSEFRERSQLITSYQTNKAALKGENAPEQHADLKAVLTKSNSVLKREYSKPEPDLQPIDVKLAPAGVQLSPVTIEPKELNIQPLNLPSVTPQSMVAANNHCKDEALMAIAQGAVTQNPRILSDLFEITSLKMAYALNESGTAKKSIESSIQGLLKKTDVQQARKKVTDLYATLGKSDDLKQIDRLTSGKVSYYGVQSRLDNAHASSLILMLAKENGSATDFTEADAATVWAVEKVRASQDQSKFAIGKFDGNLLNFSTKVYHLSQKGLTTDQINQRLNAKNAAVDASFNSAFSALDQEAKKCLSAGECKSIEALSAEQMGAVRAMVSKLAQRSPAVEKSGAQIDLSRSTVQNGVITLFLQK